MKFLLLGDGACAARVPPCGAMVAFLVMSSSPLFGWGLKPQIAACGVAENIFLVSQTMIQKFGSQHFQTAQHKPLELTGCHRSDIRNLNAISPILK
jgi:hypothetical protein